MYTCTECGAVDESWEAHACPAARGPRIKPASVALEEANQAAPAETRPGLLDLLSVDEEKLDRVIEKLERLQGLMDSGAMDRLEKLAALQDKLRL